MTEHALAHSHPERPDGHRLDEHLRSVGALAAVHAGAFGAGRWAELAGLWHDLGKYRPGFQRYIRQTGDPDSHIEGRAKGADKTHSAAGALWAARAFEAAHGDKGRLFARVLQYVIAGHHAGLDNWDGGLAARLASTEAQREHDEALAAIPPDDVLHPNTLPDDLRTLPLGDERRGIPGRFALWERMLFSSLVDADFLDTESFMDSARHIARQGPPDLAKMKAALDDHLKQMTSTADATVVNRARADVLRMCRDKAAHAPGVFTLTVPTGGGKTLSSLAFALDHAVLHDKRRVIYAIPYTSIIEQTADVFRGVFDTLGEAAVVEHHSNAESAPDRETSLSRLACENWDAPLIVTTNVQLFESLFASRTSRCRKLHNIAGSVVVLDEAQLLPPEFLQPIVDVLQLLVQDFGVTLVLCTATQPVLSDSTSVDPRRGLQRGFDPRQVTEIVDDVPGLYAALERIRVHLPASLDAPRTWPEIADEIAQHEAVLAIVGRRADARTLFDLLRRDGGDGCWHLSALMCARHRSDVIGEIKAALRQRRAAIAAGEAPRPVRVVSTQLVEAGVDLDFPVVYRALAGLDSIFQAAGRCNREGRLDHGDVHVFVPPTQPPPGLLRQARDTCRLVWSESPAEPFALDLFRRYFRLLYHDTPLDAKGIAEALRLEIDHVGMALAVRFRDAAEAFRLIDDQDSATVLVRYRSPHGGDDVNALIGLLYRDGPSRWLMRKLQRYGVGIYRHHLDRLIQAGDVREIPTCPGLYAQTEAWDGFYDPLLGANVDGAPGDPGGFVT